MTKKSDAPAIRFKGFSDAWEQRKFSDVVATRRGLTYKPSDIRKNGVRVLRSSNIADDSFTLSDEDVFVVREAVNIDCARVNDILITAANGSSRLVGKHTIISGIPEESAVHGGFMLLGTTKEPHFVNASMGSSWYRRFIELFVAGGNGAIGNLNKNDLDNQEIAIPSEGEQKKIGSFFRQLDHLITLHQRKFEKLTNVKKSMLEKMFPQNGSSYPEIRFKGFTDPWEQRKAIDIADYSKGNGYSKGNLTDAGTPIILYGRLYTKYQFAISEVDTFAVPRNGAVYSQGNEVIVPASGETAEDIARASAVEKSGVLLGGDLNILRPFEFMNPLFLALAISNGEPQKELAKKAQGKSVVHIHNSDIQEVTIAYPSRTEQDQIVSVFRQLDNLITLHQRELEKLQNIKKSMLEKMFV